ncbi:fusion protein (includes pXO2-28-29-30), partial [Bacillus cereus]|nr:fusion protein (includes pXO2-28-29-30) [Bacillus cereus]
IHPVTVSGKVNVKARLTNSWGGLSRVGYALYNPNADKSDTSQVFPTVLDFFVNNLPNRNDLRGATFPRGKINYHFDFSGKVIWDNKNTPNDVLNFEGKDTPIKIFNYQAVDEVVQKKPQPNTESFELGLTSYDDPRSIVSYSPRSYIPKEKWNASDIEKYTLNSVWDSGVTQLNKPKVDKNTITY